MPPESRPNQHRPENSSHAASRINRRLGPIAYRTEPEQIAPLAELMDHKTQRSISRQAYPRRQLPLWDVRAASPRHRIARGGMAERTKAMVLKTIVGQPTGGSNPPPSAHLTAVTDTDVR